MHGMKAVILAGGRGTRLAEETSLRPKPMVEIGGKPILWHIMKTYNHYGVKDFVICLGYKGQMIKEFFMNYAVLNSDISISSGGSVTIHNNYAEDWNVTLADTGEDSQTGGRVGYRRNARFPSETWQKSDNYGSAARGTVWCAGDGR